MPTITLTGERDFGRFTEFLDGKPLVLTKGQLRLLVRLILARRGAANDYVAASTVAIARLRQALDRAAGAGSGKLLIETGDGAEYRLALPSKALRKHLLIEPHFFELEGRGVFTKADMQALKKLGRVLKSR